MNRRVVFIASGLIAAFSVSGFCQERNDKEGASARARATANLHEVKNERIEEVVNRNLPRLKSGDRKEREVAIQELHLKLQILANSQRKYPEGETKKNLSRELVSLYTNTRDKDFSHPSIRRRLIYDIARYGDNLTAKPFLLKILDGGTKEERDEALRGLGAPGGVGGTDVYNKINDIANRKIIKWEARTAMLAQIDKDRALIEVLKDVDSSQDKQIFLHAARTLQNQYRRPEDFKRVLSRIKAFGLQKDKSYKGGNGLFWIDVQLLSAYVESAEGEDLHLALEIMTTDSTLCSPPATGALSRRLMHSDPRIRVLAAKGLKMTAEHSRADRASIKTSLHQAIGKESDPRTKSLMEGIVRSIEHFEVEWQRALERYKNERK